MNPLFIRFLPCHERFCQLWLFSADRFFLWYCFFSPEHHFMVLPCTDCFPLLLLFMNHSGYDTLFQFTCFDSAHPDSVFVLWRYSKAKISNEYRPCRNILNYIRIKSYRSRNFMSEIKTVQPTLNDIV